MNSVENRVLNFIREKSMISPGETVVVGFSGGADSTALMLVLCELAPLLGCRIIAVHMNHKIREEADEDASFARNFCEKMGAEFRLYERDVPKLIQEWGMTEEEAGRKARYEAFEEVLKECGGGVIAVAHHQNDVAESLLMNLLRGSGLHGGGSIRPVRDNIIRPLLCVTRKEIEAYLEEKGQEYCHDATNDENTHTRNVIRNIILPTMEELVNAQAIDHLCRAASDFTKADDYVRKISFDKYNEISKREEEGIMIDLTRFRPLDEIIRANIVLHAFEELTPARKDITSIHVGDILKLSTGTEGSAQISLPYNLVAQRNYDTLLIKVKDTENSRKNNKEYFVPSDLQKGDYVDFHIPNLGMAHIGVLQYNDWKLFPKSAYTKWFDYDRIQAVVFRKRRPEDYILLEQNGAKGGLCKKKITKLMTDEKIPRNKRDEIYLLADGNNVLWIPGYRMSGAFKVSEATSRILEIKITMEDNNNG